MAGRLAGKTAVITGAGSGIGRAVAVLLAEEGAQVVVTSRTRNHAEETAALVCERTGVTPMALKLDQTDQREIDAALREAAAELGPFDVLSNNGGIDDPSEPTVAATSDELWETTLEINLTGVFRLCRAAIPLLSEGGTIVNMGSVNGIVPRPNAAAYSASKAGLLHLTRSLALELAPRRIRVNCVCPGVVDTPLTDLFVAQEEDAEAAREMFARSNALCRIADAREIATCVAFLASDDASFVTGAALVVDGGQLAGD